MSSLSYRTLCKLIAVATLLRALSLVGLLEHGSMATVLGLLTLATFASAVVSAVGMWGDRTWGFVTFYFFGVMFTVLFGASLIPFILLLLPVESRFAGVFVINGIVLVAVVLLHWKRPGSAQNCTTQADT